MTIREKSNKQTVVYRGGHHMVVCDGVYHTALTSDGVSSSEGRCWCQPNKGGGGDDAKTQASL